MSGKLRRGSYPFDKQQPQAFHVGYIQPRPFKLRPGWRDENAAGSFQTAKPRHVIRQHRFRHGYSRVKLKLEYNFLGDLDALTSFQADN